MEEVSFSNAQFELSADKFQLLGETIEFSDDDIKEIDDEKVVFEFKKKNHSVIIEIWM